MINAAGLAVTPPPGWEATIYRREAAAGERTYPIMHAATVPLPSQRGDYGSGLVEALGPDDVFVSFLEFGPEAAGTPLFTTLTAVPGVTPDSYRPRQLQRTIRGQAGVQRFFTVAGRAFCMYSVIGSMTNRVVSSARANELIGTFHVDAMP
ncbi:MAG: hypothetical protein JO337_11100 [Acidimicrobiales bacterium]|nr:hypothetical protein [Acidimicrobiales bacterium]